MWKKGHSRFCFHDIVNFFYIRGNITSKGIFKGVQEEQTRRINNFLNKKALSKALHLFNSNCTCKMAAEKWGCRGDANSTLNCSCRKRGPRTQTCSAALGKTLSNICFLCSVLPLAKCRKVSCLWLKATSALAFLQALHPFWLSIFPHCYFVWRENTADSGFG